MKKGKKFAYGIVLVIGCSFSSFAQNTHNFTQFYFNPALLNPSYTGTDGRLAAYVSYRKQWVGIEGAPTVSNFSLQTALASRASFGLNANNDKNGVISTSGFLLTGAYAIPVSDKNYFRFGISIGAASNKVDINNLKFASAGDPVQTSLLANNFQLAGNVGFSFHTPTFHAGLSVPNIFDPAYLSSESFSVSKVNPFGTIIAHASNRFYFAKDKNLIEPYLIYRYNQVGPGQLEFAMVMHLQELVWVGGSFKQNYGISALAGLKLKGQTAIGYSYSIKNTGTNQLAAPSHEIHLGLLLGPKQKKAHAYSFVDAAKEKIRKTPQQLAAEKKKAADELARKKAEEKQKQDLAAKKKEEEAAALAQAKADELKKAEEARKKEEAKRQEEAAALARADELRKANEQKKKEEVKPKEPEVAKVEPVKVDSSARRPATHNGGPRLKVSTDILSGQAEIDSIHAAEQSHLARLETHADNPTEEHNETHHPNAERHEFVKQGVHHAELELGDYVIAGVFKMEANAKKYSDGLLKLGFKDSDYGYLTNKDLWYVHIAESNDLNVIKQHRDKFRKMKIFREAWLLTVHK